MTVSIERYRAQAQAQPNGVAWVQGIWVLGHIWVARVS